MEVRIAVLATKREKVSSLAGDDLLNREGDAADDGHQPQVDVLVHVADHVLDMPLLGHQHLAAQRGVGVEECKVLLAVVDGFMLVRGVAPNERADKARPGAHTPPPARLSVFTPTPQHETPMQSEAASLLHPGTLEPEGAPLPG